MKCKKKTDYRTVDPEAVYELKKVALRLRRKGKEVKEICEITGLADKTVRVVKVQAKKMHINMISAISNQGGLHFLLYSDAINSERLIGFMEALIKTSNGRKVYFILDNLKVHHSKLVSQWVDAHKDEIALFHLTPYSPEYNPDEYLNNDLKQSIGSQAMVQDIQELEDNTSAFMDRLSGDPDHVKAYFDHPTLTKYELD